LLFAWAISESLYAQQPDRTTEHGRSPGVDAIIDGYRANRRQIPFGRVKMVNTQGYAQSLSDALARDWSAERAPIRTSRLWASSNFAAKPKSMEQRL